ncbi:MAG: GDCCVxC domain-containing (seleno)protein [Paracoccaceae bacterium]|nr:GDCCVxC domain-containing (seleno)protein [Paracoccaceae bacterium]
MTSIIATSTLTCPKCGAKTTAEMLTDACQYFWDCPSCKAVLRPKAGDCCVWCSYGTVPCPPVQAGEGCCG